MAFKQVVPEHKIVLAGVISFRTKVLPMIALSTLGILVTILWIIGAYDYYLEFLVMYFHGWSGILGSWGYLRFYQKRDGIQGDRSETFSMASFFPESWHALLAPISTIFFEFAVKVKIISGTSRYAPLDNLDDSGTKSVKPSVTQDIFSDEGDSERRRAIGLKALEVKLSQI